MRSSPALGVLLLVTAWGAAGAEAPAPPALIVKEGTQDARGSPIHPYVYVEQTMEDSQPLMASRTTLSWFLRVPSREAFVASNGTNAPSGVELTVNRIEERSQSAEAPSNETRGAIGTSSFHQAPLRLSVESLLEFDDVDRDHLVDPGEILQEWRLADMEFEAVAVERTASSLLLTATSKGPPTFTLRMLVPEAESLSAGVPIHPGQSKIDFELNHLEYSSPRSSVALSLKATAVRGQPVQGTHAGEPGLQWAAEPWLAYFTWAPVAEVDGVPMPVVADVRLGSPETRINLLYPRGLHIIHDPMMGIAPVDSMAGATFLLAAGVLICSVALVLFGRQAIRRTLRKD